MVILKRTNNLNPDFKNLIMELDNDLHNRYNNMKYQYDAYTQLDNLETVIVAYMEDVPVGCSCFKRIGDDTVEIKRTFVNPYLRGLGLASSILNELTFWAKELRFRRAVLEIGKKQDEAYNLYLKNGFVRIPNFEPYIGSRNSICMGKDL
ncbi:MAG: family N-acetyltransferase [Sphingobacteriales bacterium]|nr:family N-acetyltransferase [Sphingobacteriales bacterium]